MKYLLDTNTFIEAKNSYYRFSFCPGFWSWVRQKNSENLLFVVDKVKGELLAGNDHLKEWINNCPSSLFLRGPNNISNSLKTVTEWVSANSIYTDAARATFFGSTDYFVIAYAHALREATVVTREQRDPNSKARVKIPDVCHGIGVPCIDPFQLMESSGANLVQNN